MQTLIDFKQFRTLNSEMSPCWQKATFRLPVVMLLLLLVLIDILVVTSVHQARLAAVLRAAAFPRHLHLMMMLEHVLLLVALSLLLVLVRIHNFKSANLRCLGQVY